MSKEKNTNQDSYPYEIRDNCLYVTTVSKRGSSTSKVCNFVPHIVSEKTVDDGAVTEKTLVFSGIHADGSTLPPVEVNGADLSNFNWLLDKWGAKCIIEVGQRCKDQLRYYIQTTSEYAAQQAVDIEYEKPANIFVRKLYALMESGDIVLKKKGSYGDYTPSFFSGIVNSDYLMIHLDSVFPLIKKLCSDSGEAFPYTKNSIMKALVEEGIAEPGRQSTTRVTKIQNFSMRLLYLRKDKTDAIAEVNGDVEEVA